MSPSAKDPSLIVRQERPFNGGPAPAALARDFVTPVEHWFVRNHGDVPEVDRDGFRLEIRGEVERPLELAPADLDRFPRRELTATIQCAGNRRSELIARKAIPHELPWGSEAISTAVWSGVALADVLAAAEPKPGALHAAFCGLDDTERHGKRFHFGGSIPLAKALSPEVLLATGMNGAPLPAIHGAPLRVVVPGWIGARSVKWLHKIKLQTEPSDNYFQRVAYRLFPAAVGPDNVVWDEGAMLGEQAVNAIVTAPGPGELVAGRPVLVRGLALAGGGRRVERVELTLDEGMTWIQARLDGAGGPWTWRLWSAELALPPGEHRLAARAFDSAGQTQPSSVDQVWNFKGYMNNAWHRVAFRVGA